MTDSQNQPHQTTPLILRLLREERDRIERMMDQFSTTISWPGYERHPWFDDAAHLAAERLKLAECNAAIGGLTQLSKAADEIDRLANALRVIAGELPPFDYLLGHADLARIVLHGR